MGSEHLQKLFADSGADPSEVGRLADSVRRFEPTKRTRKLVPEDLQNRLQIRLEIHLNYGDV